MIFFQIGMLAIDAGILTIYWLRRWVWIWLAASVAGGAAAVLLMLLLRFLLRQDYFEVAQYAAWAGFIHAPLVLLGTAALSLRKNRFWAATTAASALLLWGLGIEAFWIEPHWLEVTHYQITSRKIRQPIRIVVIADPQMDRFGDYEREALDRAFAEKADMILWAGDYLQAPWEQEQQVMDEARKYLVEKDARPPLGAYAVGGNTDPGMWVRLFTDTGVTPVFNRRTFACDPICLTCLSLSESFAVSLRVPDPDPEKFHIVLGHAPNFARGDVQADLLIAGHTHGGQVRLPGLGPVITNSRVPRRWAAGMTELSGGRKLFVSRGVGMERSNAPRLRLFCRPEVAVIELLPEEGSNDE